MLKSPCSVVLTTQLQKCTQPCQKTGNIELCLGNPLELQPDNLHEEEKEETEEETEEEAEVEKVEEEVEEEVESDQAKKDRALQRLLYAVHSTLDIRYEEFFTNHIVHNLYTLAELGADHERLAGCYRHKRKRVWRLQQPKEFLAPEDPHEHIEDPRYYSTFLRFYEQKIEELGFDETFNQFIHQAFSGLLGAVAFAYANCADQSATPLSNEFYKNHSDYSKNDVAFRSVLETIQKDSRYDDVDWYDEQILLLIPPMLATHKTIVREHFLSATINEGTSTRAAAAFSGMYIGTSRNNLFDFFIAHILTTSNGIDFFYSMLPPHLQLSLIRSLWLHTVIVYICQARPTFDQELVLEPFRDEVLYSWPNIIKKTVDHMDEHTPKIVEVMGIFEKRYGYCNGKWRATAAATCTLVDLEYKWCYIGLGIGDSELVPSSTK
ncbi:hypothetical protein BDF19DRAFT_449591 [Syncephalis fuscata]|nr:hypothetical protein BDF19DRAFT_449591 [Syncephalis fuscata]